MGRPSSEPADEARQIATASHRIQSAPRMVEIAAGSREQETEWRPAVVNSDTENATTAGRSEAGMANRSRVRAPVLDAHRVRGLPTEYQSQYPTEGRAPEPDRYEGQQPQRRTSRRSVEASAERVLAVRVTGNHHAQ